MLFGLGSTWLPLWLALALAGVALLAIANLALIFVIFVIALARGRRETFADLGRPARIIGTVIMMGFVLIWPISAALVYLGMSAIIIGSFPVALLGVVEITVLIYLLSELFSYSSARRAKRAVETRPENQQ